MGTDSVDRESGEVLKKQRGVYATGHNCRVPILVSEPGFVHQVRPTRVHSPLKLSRASNHDLVTFVKLKTPISLSVVYAAHIL